MNATDVRSFIFGQTIYSTDTGHYGFDDQMYWTRYKGFRAGKKHSFYLQKADEFSAQAVHQDGIKAYLLSHQPPL